MRSAEAIAGDRERCDGESEVAASLAQGHPLWRKELPVAAALMPCCVCGQWDTSPAWRRWDALPDADPAAPPFASWYQDEEGPVWILPSSALELEPRGHVADACRALAGDRLELRLGRRPVPTPWKCGWTIRTRSAA